MKKFLKVLGVIVLVLTSINANTIKNVTGLTQDEIIENLNDPNEEVTATRDETDDVVKVGRNTTTITFTQDNNYKLAHANGSNWAYYFYATDSNGNPAFCIQPGVYMYGGNYSSFNPGYLTPEQKDRVRLLLYYGYPNAGTDLTYRFATQILISETVTGQDYAVFAGNNIVDTSVAEAKINNDVAKHYYFPSFGTTNVSVNRNENITLTDINNRLDDYNIISQIPGGNITKSGNQLMMSFSNPGTYTIQLERQAMHGQGNSYFYWFSNNSQNVASGHGYDPHTTSLTVTVREITGSLEISKIDSANGSLLPGAVFELRRSDNSVYGTYTTTESILRINNLPFGQYTLKEVKAPNGFNLSTETFNVNISTQGQLVKIEVPNDLITSTLEISKIDSKTKNHIAGAELVIEKLNENGDWVEYGTYESKIEDLVVDDVAYGKYRIREIKAPLGYVLENLNIEFEVNENGAKIELVLENTEITSTLEISKIDSKTKNHIAGAELVIEKLNEKGDWVEYGTYESKTEALFIDDVAYGKYRIREIKAPLGYVLENLNIEFEVNKNGAKIELVLENSKILTETGNTNIFQLILIISLILIVFKKMKGVKNDSK